MSAKFGGSNNKLQKSQILTKPRPAPEPGEKLQKLQKFTTHSKQAPPFTTTCKFADCSIENYSQKITFLKCPTILSNFFEGQKLFDGTPCTALKINKSRGVGCPIFLSNYFLSNYYSEGEGFEPPVGPETHR